ncbi:hypothetical protein Lalb_Chr07g0180791 [Lupinus albus]|uniref:Clavata3/ESR (CLE) gene family member n=1 Tax=Lupinus albus TaxID=3870 RepID=A0A6A4Q7G3_LUPAL|nr:hypothetical protein Lalb_Chr07g0180791 [Lupinus albus]
MRFLELIFVLCLLFLACIGSNTMARKTMFVTNMFDGAKVKNTSMAVDDSHTKSNKNTISDEKRVVPTGSNPLHNR